MPIKAENRARYPKDWSAISKRIRERSGGRCECEGECGISHHADDPYRPDLAGKEVWRCYARNAGKHPVTGSTVVLTVAHLDHTPEHCADDNLRAMCQRCHLKYDAHHHARNSAETRRKRRADGDLFK